MKSKSTFNKEAEIRSENDAFKRIRPGLENLGWRYVEKYVTWFEYMNSLNIVLTSALKLENKGTIFALIPNGNGIEISKEGLSGPRNFHNRVLNNLHYFLIKNDINEIYRPLYDDYGYKSPKDRADYEINFPKRLKERSFVAQEDVNKAKLDVKAFQEQYDLGDVDYDLLSRSLLNRVSSLAKKSVDVYFEFTENEDNNFNVLYHFEDYDSIRRKVLELIMEMPKDDQSNLIIKTLFAQTFKETSEITNEERDFVHNAFKNILERAAESENYRLLLRQIGFVIIGSFHCEIRGFENSINCYTVIIDTKLHTYQIGLKNNKLK